MAGVSCADKEKSMEKPKLSADCFICKKDCLVYKKISNSRGNQRNKKYIDSRKRPAKIFIGFQGRSD